MSDKPGLEVEVGVTLNRLQRQLAQAEARMNKTASKMEKDFGKANRRVERGFKRANASAGQFANGGARNVALQLSQVAQQGAATGNFMGALAIQLPDLAMGFGTLGVALGAAGAVLAPFALDLLKTGEAAEPLEDRIDALASAVTAYKDAIEAAGGSYSDLAERFGAEAREARALLEVRRELAATEAQAASRSAMTGLQAEFGGAGETITSLEQFERLTKRLAEITSRGGPGGAGIQAMLEQVQRLNDEFGLTVEEAFEFNAALQGLDGPMEQQVDAAQTLVRLMSGAGGATSEVAEEARALLQQLIDASLNTMEIEAAMSRVDDATANVNARVATLTDGLSSAATEAVTLAGNIASAIGAAAEWAETRRRENGGWVRGGFAGWLGQGLRNMREEAAANLKGGGGAVSRGGGGGGMSAAQRERNALMREGEQLTQRLRTAEERRADEMERLNRLLAVGAIDQETYNRALADLETSVGGAAGRLDEIGGSLRSTFDAVFDSLIDGSADASAVLEDLGRQLIKIGTYQALAGIAPDVFGAEGLMPLVNANGNAFVNGRVQPFARGGVVSGPTLFPMRGGTGLMGEAGPEAILPLKRVNGRLGVEASARSGPAPINVTIDARGAQVGVAEQIDAKLAQRLPEIQRAAVGAVQDSRMRGRMR